MKIKQFQYLQINLQLFILKLKGLGDFSFLYSQQRQNSDIKKYSKTILKLKGLNKIPS
ncbi:hypothetical protein pb186bvf_001830 [Paramecium bursaria]